MFVDPQTHLLLLSYTIIIILLMVFLVFRYSSSNEEIRKAFSFLSVSIIIWLVSIYLSLVLVVHNQILFCARISIMSAAFINFSTIFMVNILLSKKIFSSKAIITFFVSTLAISIFCLSPLVFKDVLVERSNINMVLGPLMPVVVIHTFFVFIFLIYLLINSRKEVSIEFKKIQLIILGFLGMYFGVLLGIMVPIVLFHSAFLVKIAPLYMLIFFIPLTIAVVKYQLFNIKYVAVEILVVLLDSFLFLQIFFNNSFGKTIINTIVFCFVLLLSWLLYKSNRYEMVRYQKEIQMSALEESHAKLKELDRQKTEFLTIAAHQLRTPVSIIKNYVSMLADGDYGQIPDNIKDVLTNIDQSSQWLVRLGDEFLNIANLEQGQTKYHMERCDVQEIVQDVMTELAPKAERAGVKLEWQKHSEPITMWCDKEKLRAVIFNFVDNAIKYGVNENSDKISSVIIAVEQKDNGVVVRITDNGIGFNFEDEARFFQKFSRGENAQAIHVNLSTGLGLYICRKFIEGHNGTVWAKSAGPGKGSEFGFRIPLHE